MHSVSVEFDQKEKEEPSFSTLLAREVIELLDENLHVKFREDWIRLLNGLKIPKNRKDTILVEISSILKENNFDEETW
tara:strand:+ start:191 stop:424 length:234 start_codon:yes stop_codon:yes gene_type:complete